jgi:hypothetical protein
MLHRLFVHHPGAIRHFLPHLIFNLQRPAPLAPPGNGEDGESMQIRLRNKPSKLWTLLWALMLIPSLAFAQADDDDIPLDDEEEDVMDDDEDEDLGLDDDDDDDGPPKKVAKPVASGGEKDDSGAAGGDAPAKKAEEEDVSDVQTIYVIQVKPRLVAGSFEFSPQFAQSINDRFTTHTGFIVSGIYHLKENVAFELAGGYLWGRDTDMTVEIRQKERLAPELVQLYRLTWLATADLQWSPIYGKVSLHDLILGQFNIYLSVGAGATGLQLENQQALG